VNNYVAGIDQYPITLRLTFNANTADAVPVEFVEQVTRDRADVAVRAAASDDHEVGNGSLTLEIDLDGVEGFLVVETGEDDFQDFCGRGTRA